MDTITQSFALFHGDDLANVQDYKVELPEFPLWWLDKSKRNIEGLREIASHLHCKTAALRASRDGFKGVTTEMEKQLINHVIELEQQVYVQNDALQSAIQIIVTEHERKPSQRIKRASIKLCRTTGSIG